MDNNQKIEMINKVIDQFTLQNCLAKDHQSGSCYYRGEDGVKCAIGVFIPDELYDPDMEDNSITDLLKQDKTREILVKSGLSIDIDSATFYRQLQEIHDNSDSVSQCIEALKSLRDTLK